MSTNSIFSGLQKTLLTTPPPTFDDLSDSYDVVIRFHSAEDLPRMDISGKADPYFVAKIDDEISFTSTILSNTLTPGWEDEEWIVRNIPSTAKLSVTLYDKDDDKIVDDYIGKFEIPNLINYRASSNGHNIIGPFNRGKGRFHLSVQSTISSPSSQTLPRYTFDGPCRFSRHDSFSVGRLTMLNADCVYSTWKIQMRRIPFFFRPHERQEWNREYKAAQSIFGGSPLSLATQHSIKLAHKVLYGRTLKNNESGRLMSADDLWKLIFFNRKTQRIEPCLYTYIIDDNTWRFSETGAGVFTDFASKHALHANASEHVRYAGEFHLRPKFGWDRCDDEWELVIDNGSGTYAPSVGLLDNLKALLLFNFPGLNVVVSDFKDPVLKDSIKQMKLVAEQRKHSINTINRLMIRPPIGDFK